MSDRWTCSACGGWCCLELNEPSDPPFSCPWGCKQVDWRDTYIENERIDMERFDYEARKRGER